MYLRAVLSMGLFALSVSTAWGQNITVQQPVFNSFSVGTTVSVPDRGTAFLGGVGRAGASRNNYGPLRSGTSSGVFREHAGASVTATIHDFEEMDRLLLGQGSQGVAPGRPLPRNAEHAWESLSRQQAAGSTRSLTAARGIGSGSPARMEEATAPRGVVSPAAPRDFASPRYVVLPLRRPRG